MLILCAEFVLDGYEKSMGMKKEHFKEQRSFWLLNFSKTHKKKKIHNSLSTDWYIHLKVIIFRLLVGKYK